jgi:Zn-dependent peptidase ImmA (M78 family)/transcriptional regulator with XRE-family HTH domain
MTEAEDRLMQIAFGLRAAHPEEAARRSGRVYVRGISQLAEDHPEATGRRLTALEALKAYGLEVVAQVAAEGVAPLAPSAEVAGRVLKYRRTQLGLAQRQVAVRARVPEEVVKAAEQSRRLPIRQYERVARALGLDERYVLVRPEPEGNERIAVRLRTIGQEDPRLGQSTVSALAEAAWVAMAQVRLEKELSLPVPQTGIVQSDNYGSPGIPAYRMGYQLAADARQRLGLGTGPIASMRALAEESLGLPIIQAELGESIAGVTIEVSSRRAIVINLSGKNRHVFVRRATIAHELGHLLYDSPRRLNELRVDAYSELEAPPDQIRDPVEQRANAFSVELLLPQLEAVALFRASQDDPVGEVMERFGVSFTAARYQIWNALHRSIPLDELVTDHRGLQLDWEARERYTVDYHPIRDLRPTRAGRFSAVTVRAAEEGLVSWDTAAEWLETSVENVRRAAPQCRELFPSVWNAAGR